MRELGALGFFLVALVLAAFVAVWAAFVLNEVHFTSRVIYEDRSLANWAVVSIASAGIVAGAFVRFLMLARHARPTDGLIWLAASALVVAWVTLFVSLQVLAS